MLAEMRETLVRARLGLDDLRRSIDATRRRLDAERKELETVRRRKTLAEGISDRETVVVAERFERLHSEKVVVLERKLETLEAELVLTEREVGEMNAEYRSATGVRGSARSAEGAVPASGAPSNAGTDATSDNGSPSPPAEPDVDDAALRHELEALERARRRASTDADAAEKLAALKRRMGK